MTHRASRLSDTLLDDLRQANPVRGDSLPSPRDRQPAQTLEQILMSTAPNSGQEPGSEAAIPIGDTSRRRGRIISLAAAVITVAAVGVGVFAIDFRTAPNASAAVHSAAAASVGDSVRWETRVTIGLAEPDEPLEFSITGLVSGDNAEIIWHTQSDMSAVGLPEIGPFSVVAVDGEVYISPAEGVWEGPRPASEFPLLSAIAADTMIGDLQQVTGFTKVGNEDAAGEKWTRYQSETAPNDPVWSILILTLGIAQIPLDADPADEFESASLNVWIDGDNLIRRVSFDSETASVGSFSVVTTLGGFGGPIEIARPIA